MSKLARFSQYESNANVIAFLKVIRFCEGTSDENGYKRMFGGKLFSDFKDHPRDVQTFRLRKGGTLSSSAAGAYQFLSRTWDGLVKQYGFGDFSPPNQDLAAIALIDGRKALIDLVRGDLPTVVKKCALEWASLPGSPYGQPVKKYSEVLSKYLEHGGLLTPQGEAKPVQEELPGIPTVPVEVAPPVIQPTTEAAPVPPILLPIVKMGLLEILPKLVNIFGSGSETSNKNVKAVEAVAEIAKNAIGAKNEQELLEVIKADPAAVDQIKNAIEADWFTLQQIGGGIEAAQKQDRVYFESEGPWWQVFKSPSFIVGFFGLLPMVYIILLSLVGVLGEADWSDDVRASIAGMITGTIVGGLVGYYYGQSTSRNRTPAP